MIDVLVTRGYVEREPDPADRRRLLLVLTSRGEAAADLIEECRVRSDAALLEMIDPEKVATTRWVLAHMTKIPSDVGLR